jgi:hypothetical protein
MFVFNNSEDRDLRTYQYELYEDDQVTGTYPNFSLITNAVPLSSGNSNSSVFTVAVDGSYVDELGVEQPKDYYGRVRSIDTSSNSGEWTSILKTDQSTPLIDEQYIVRLTADRIKAGTIESAEIILGGANPAETIIRSSTYDSATPTTGWYIRGNGQASIGGPNGINFNGSILSPAITLGSNVTILSGAAVPNSSGVAFSGLTISTAVGTIGGIQLGSDANNQWLTSGYFRTGNSTKYMEYNPAGSGSLVFTGSIQIGTGESVFKADTNGIYLGNETFASAEFRVTPAGALTATNANITGAITGSTVSGSTVTVGTFDGVNTGLRITSDGFIQGSGGGVKIKNWDGSTGTYLFGNSITTVSSNIENGSFTNKLEIGGLDNKEYNFYPDANQAAEFINYSNDLDPYLNFYRRLNIGGSNPRFINFYKMTGSGNTNTEIARFNINNADSGLTLAGCATAPLSDKRLKLVLNNNLNFLNIIKQIEPIKFKWKNNSDNTEYMGFLAQDLFNIIPEAVLMGDNDDPVINQEDNTITVKERWGIDYSYLVSYLVGAVKELSAKVDELESRLV